jgi:hypothetical protein
MQRIYYRHKTNNNTQYRRTPIVTQVMTPLQYTKGLYYVGEDTWEKIDKPDIQDDIKSCIIEFPFSFLHFKFNEMKEESKKNRSPPQIMEIIDTQNSDIDKKIIKFYKDKASEKLIRVLIKFDHGLNIVTYENIVMKDQRVADIIKLYEYKFRYK